MTEPAPLLRRHQREALDALEQAIDTDDRRSWIVLPPGAGKTRVGVEHARTLLDRGEVGTVVAFGPNTAIQSQWADTWNRLGGVKPDGSNGGDGADGDDGPNHDLAGTDRDLATRFTALTYQSLAVFDADRDATSRDPDPRSSADRETTVTAATSSLLDDLAPGGRALVDRLAAAGPILLILDECHHLLEVWGTLLAELLDLLPEAWVHGLTATPPETMTKGQSQLVRRLFSEVRYSASIPAVVREGDLAPFADLVWVSAPTPAESDWLSGQALRFKELTTSLIDPEQGSVPFLEWLDRRFLGTRAEAVSWEDMNRAIPDLCAAALRMHHAGLLRLPPGARPGEAHRRDPDIEDWAALIDDWMRGHLLASDDPADEALAEAIRRALPALGFRFTRKGIRRGRTPVDRVLAHSASKPAAAVDIIAAEADNLGDRLRMLALCDFESATATLSADIREVLEEGSGSALLVLETLLADPRTAGLGPMLVSGSTVAGAPDVLAEFVRRLGEDDPQLAAQLQVSEPRSGVSRLEGRWTSRDWVPRVTGFFVEGGARVLIGTRALLGEGWDAPAITGLIDLSSATTSAAVTQTRGRALRRDPAWSGKVALNWTVVCVAAEHPRGDQDWARLVRKHDGFFGTDADGEVVDGVAHIDPAFSPYEPPSAIRFDEINARMIRRSQDRSEIAERWKVGSDYRDEALRSVRIVGGGSSAESRKGADSQEFTPGADGGIGVSPRHLGGDPGHILPFALTWRTAFVWAGLGLVLAALALLLLPSGGGTGGGLTGGLTGGLSGSVVLGVLAVIVWLSWPVLLWVAGVRRCRVYGSPPTVAQLAGAIAEALHGAGLSSAGAEAVRLRVDAQGDLRCRLEADRESAETFALALDEAVSPISAPRYVLPRWSLHPVASGSAGASGSGGASTGVVGVRAGLRAGLGTPQRGSAVWHAVPTVLGARKQYALTYAGTWDRWIGGGEPLYTGNPEGAGVLAAVRGANPMSATSVLRMTWH